MRRYEQNGSGRASRIRRSAAFERDPALMPESYKRRKASSSLKQHYGIDRQQTACARHNSAIRLRATAMKAMLGDIAALNRRSIAPISDKRPRMHGSDKKSRKRRLRQCGRCSNKGAYSKTPPDPRSQIEEVTSVRLKATEASSACERRNNDP